MLKRFVLAGLALLLATVAWSSVAENQFLLFEDLEVGMEGVGKTIVRSNEIRTFQARIVALIDAPGELHDFIEIRVSGDAIRESGGVAAGMSGSPIYIDGKLIGALSRAISFDSSPSPFALVTPIGPMLTLVQSTRQLAATHLDQASLINVDPTQVGDADLTGYTQLELTNALPPETIRQLHPQRLYAVPIATPVMVSGMGGRAFDWFRSGIPDDLKMSMAQQLTLAAGRRQFLDEMGIRLENRFPITLMDSGLPGRQTTPIGSMRGVDDLVPGGALSVTLADGDVTIGALGTVTYREDDVVLGFGHSFLFTGDVEYFLARAYIYDTVANLQTPFKFGTSTERMGTLFQDRFQGIGGIVGVKPKSVRMNVRMTNGETGEVSHYSIDFVQDNTFLASLVFSSGLSLMDQTLNRVGKGTVMVDYTIRGAGLPRRVEHDDIFTSLNDIAVPGPLQVAQVVFLLAQNEFEDPQLDTIDMDISFVPEVRLSRLTSLVTDKESYRPGDLVSYTATFSPYRGESFTVDGQLRIPEGVSSSRLTLHGFGGPRPTSTSNADNNAPTFEDLGQIIEVVEQLSRNDQLTVELLGISQNDLSEQDETVYSQQINDWVITGEQRVQLTIDQSTEPTVTPETQTPEGSDPTEEEQSQASDEEDQAPQQQSGDNCQQLFFCSQK